MKFPFTFHVFCMVLAILPFTKSLGRIELGVVTFTPYLLGLFALAPLAALRAIKSPGRYGFSLTDLSIALLGLAYLISTVQSNDIIDSGFLAFHALFVPAVSYFVVKAFIQTHEQYERTVAVLVCSIAVLAPFAVAGFVLQGERPTVFKVHPIGIATLTVLALTLLCGSGRWRRLWGYAAFMVILAGFLATLSRVYLVMMLVAPFLYWQFRRGRAMPIYLCLMTGTLLFTVFLAASPDLFLWKEVEGDSVRTVARMFDPDFWKKALYARALDYSAGLANFKDHMFFGTGLYQGELVITRHNFHIEWLEYGGLVGYGLYAAVIMAHVARAGSWARHDPMLAASLVALLIVLSNSVTNGIMHGIIPYVAFIIIGLGEARVGILKGSRRWTRGPRPINAPQIVPFPDIQNTAATR